VQREAKAMMIRPLLGGVIFLASMASVACAADVDVLPYKAPPIVYSWTGFYVGGNVGADTGSFDPNTSTVFNPLGYFDPLSVPDINLLGPQLVSPSAVTGGLEFGYNWQVSRFVFGLEGDVDSFRLSGRATGGTTYSCCAPATFTINATASTDWLATLRGRVGVAEDNWLFYATGGAALTTLHGTFSFVDDFGASEGASISATRLGYAAGGGIECGFWTHWSVKAEYLFVDFSRVSTAGGLNFSPLNPFTHSIDLRANIGRVGVNYRF
jgi:outer membrane immunogenic protein